MKKIKVGISVGDINGIGLEVILKTISNPKIVELCTPVIYGSSKVVSYHRNIVGIEDFQFQSLRNAETVQHGKINIVNCWQENVNISLGAVTEEGGQYAIISLEKAVADLKKNYIDALVTAPINKKAMNIVNFSFPGHTEYLTKTFGAEESLMFMIAENLRIGVATNHVPLKDVAKFITKERILKKLHIMHETLKVDFGIEKPTIAVLGLNPHAGDGGVLGDEEEKIILPAILEAKKKGGLVFGPYPADGFFGTPGFKKFDAILAMYHDQGLVPFKLMSFGNGVNFTAGLSIIRTSPDHGTAMDIAGQNLADPSSFRHALYRAIDIARCRGDYMEMHENPIVKRTKHLQEDDLTAGALKEVEGTVEI